MVKNFLHGSVPDLVKGVVVRSVIDLKTNKTGLRPVSRTAQQKGRKIKAKIDRVKEINTK